MFILIHSLEILLVVSIASLGYRVFKAYQAEYQNLAVSESDVMAVAVVADPSDTKLDGNAIVEAYIDDFFVASSDEMHNPLHAFKVAEQSDRNPIMTADAEQLNTENTDRSISNKVMRAMMAEADLACAS